ncbi:BnaC03g13020D [Brassica napus]|uniref:BnaC03g13020D protein n=2 Tax=Brassica TaxID=3705 RepID=A0A078FF14_BRANA|nr:BnaC03g13020D [Brassica napus]
MEGPLSSTRETSKHPLLPPTISSGSLYRLLSQPIPPVAFSFRSLSSALPPPSARCLFPLLKCVLESVELIIGNENGAGDHRWCCWWRCSFWRKRWWR